MKTTIKALGLLCFACFAGVFFSAVLHDHGITTRLPFDLFCVATLVTALPLMLAAALEL